MLDEPTARKLANHWEGSWNAQDIDLIMEPLGKEVVFSSPFVSKIFRDSSKWTVEGYDAVRSYLAESLKRCPGRHLPTRPDLHRRRHHCDRLHLPAA